MKVTSEMVRAAFNYDPDTGALTWKNSTSNRRRQGQKAGSLNTRTGRWHVCLHYQQIAVHRVVWMHWYGEPPKHNIDHINGDPGDNRIANLRDVPQSVNLQNQRRAHVGSRSGLLGVSWYNKNRCWRARIGMNGKQITIGYYQCKQVAYEAYLKAKQKLHIGNTI